MSEPNGGRGVGRRLVVVLFADLVGWTGLAEQVDAEVLQQLLEQYYEICSCAVDDYGGVVEKFIGDAVMAVFGAASSREDDAVRAARAALQMQAGVRALESPAGGAALQVHCGIAAGEAFVTRSPRAGLRVVGDVVNVAARLQSAAGPEEVLVNDVAAQLCAHELGLESVAALRLKGKLESVVAMRLSDARGPDDAYRELTSLVDRTAERSWLSASFAEVVASGRAQLVSLVGPPGIGKSRLLREVFQEQAAVFCHCPSYGPDANLAPIVSLLDGLLLRCGASRQRLVADRRLNAVLVGLRSATTARPAQGSADPDPGLEEITWAARELLLAACTEPLVVVWDGLDWAGPTVLGLMDALLEAVREHPVLMIRVARSAQHAGRDDRLEHGEVLSLGALEPADSVELMSLLSAAGTGGEVQLHATDVSRMCTYGAGNPLVIRLLLEAATPGSSAPALPPTVTALIGASIDRLPEPAQLVLGAASALGSTFTVDQLVHLVEIDDARAGLDTLVEHQLLRPGTTVGGYLFAQQLVHEVAYSRLSKQQRMRWHLHLADHEVGPAFHLEAAARLLAALRPTDPGITHLEARAAAALLAEGTAALRQRDAPGSIALFDRADQLVPASEPGCRAAITLRRCDALLLNGELREASQVLRRAGAQPGAAAHPEFASQACVLDLRLGRVNALEADRILAEVDLSTAGPVARCRREQLQMLVDLDRGLFGSAESAVRRALVHARAALDPYEQDRLDVALCEIGQWSPTPIAEKLDQCADLLSRFAADRVLLLPVLTTRARHLALLGEAERAGSALEQASIIVEDLRPPLGQVLLDQTAGLLRALEGAHGAARARYQRAADVLERAGLTSAALDMQVHAVREQVRDGDVAAARAIIAALLQRQSEMTLSSRVVLCASAGRVSVGAAPADPLFGQAQVLNCDALELMARTDDPCLRGDAYAELAALQLELGDRAAARALARAATESYSTVGALKPMSLIRELV